MIPEKTFRNVIDALMKGIEVSEDAYIYCSEPKQGRFREEFNVDIFLSLKEKNFPLVHAKVFLGRGYYRDWIEIFGINANIPDFSFFGSTAEEKILDIFSSLTSRLFVEYFEDKETAKELSLGVPVYLSRLGFEIAKRGFTWFKDWYFPEGLMEGGHKIQAERALTEEQKRKHIKELKEEFETFKRKCSDNTLKDKIEKRYKILQDLWKG